MSEERIDVSFILPVYNVKPYIEECIASIRDQGLEHYEIICVEDCSTDDSPEELRRLAEACPEIRILQNDRNHGLCYSRNRGIEEARGEYIWFVDPDDLLLKGAAAPYLRFAREQRADAVFGRRLAFADGSPKPDPHQEAPAFRRVDFADPRTYYPIHRDGMTGGGAWMGPFRREPLLEHGIRFREELCVYEDITFHFEFGVLAANAVYQADYDGYLYRIRRTSAMRKNGKTRAADFYPSTLKLYRVMQDYAAKCDPRLKESVEAHLQECRMSAMTFLFMIDDRAFVMKELRSLKEQGIYPFRYKKAYAFRHKSPREYWFGKLISHSAGFRLLYRMRGLLIRQ